MSAVSDRLRFGELGPRTAHVCVDMQRMFAEDTAWKTPWFKRVLPNVVTLVAAHPAETIFTRFIPAKVPGEGRGTWRRYYERWPQMTLRNIGWEMVELVPELARFVPPAVIVDKHVYSPWFEQGLTARLMRGAIDTLVVSGGETDVCVLSTVLGAVDRGYRIVVAADALCSSSDATHDALLCVYESRFGTQIEAVATAIILDNWP